MCVYSKSSAGRQLHFTYHYYIYVGPDCQCVLDADFYDCKPECRVYRSADISPAPRLKGDMQTYLQTYITNAL